jgi:hypothetical protein
VIAANVRADSWAGTLEAAEMWAVYDYHYNPDGGAAGKWEITAAWAEKEFKLKRRPSREAFYKWLKAMRDLAPAHRREVRETADEIAAESAKSLTVNDDEIIAFAKSRALDAATVAKNPKEAERFIRMAETFIRAGQKDAELTIKRQELELKNRAQSVKEDELKLAQEKFAAAERRENAAKATVTDNRLSDTERMAKLKEIYGL